MVICCRSGGRGRGEVEGDMDEGKGEEKRGRVRGEVEEERDKWRGGSGKEKKRGWGNGER